METTTIYHCCADFHRKNYYFGKRELFYVHDGVCGVYVIHFAIKYERPCAIYIHLMYRIGCFKWKHHRIIATSYSSHIIEIRQFYIAFLATPENAFFQNPIISLRQYCMGRCTTQLKEEEKCME